MPRRISKSRPVWRIDSDFITPDLDVRVPVTIAPTASDSERYAGQAFLVILPAPAPAPTPLNVTVSIVAASSAARGTTFAPWEKSHLCNYRSDQSIYIKNDENDTTRSRMRGTSTSASQYILLRLDVDVLTII